MDSQCYTSIDAGDGVPYVQAAQQRGTSVFQNRASVSLVISLYSGIKQAARSLTYPFFFFFWFLNQTNVFPHPSSQELSTQKGFHQLTSGTTGNCSVPPLQVLGKAFRAPPSCFKPVRLGQRSVRERLLVARRPAPLLTAALPPTPCSWRLPKSALRVEEKIFLCPVLPRRAR